MSDLPFLPLASRVNVNHQTDDGTRQLTRVEERGGPWDSFTLEPASLPALRSNLPITVVYKKVQGAWQQHLLIAESALLRRAGAKPGLGVYALHPFRGPKSLQGSKERLGEEIGHYGGAVVASAPTQRDAMEQVARLALQGFQYLFPVRVFGKTGWHVVNGEAQPVLPFLYRVNDVRGTQFLPKCRVSETGAFSALRVIPVLDLSKPLFDQAGSELSFDYGNLYWSVHSKLGTAELPLQIEARWAVQAVV